MIKKIKTYLDLPLTEGQVCDTKFQSGETFTIKKITYNNGEVIRIEGIYNSSPHLGLCPINADRLIPERVEHKEITVCGKCGTEINN
jgi:hypothetical protein